MASIREIKKEVNESFALFIDDCYEKRAVSKKDIAAETEALIDQAITLFDELIHSINNPSKEVSASVQFNQIEEKFDSELAKLYKSLSQLD